MCAMSAEPACISVVGCCPCPHHAVLSSTCLLAQKVITCGSNTLHQCLVKASWVMQHCCHMLSHLTQSTSMQLPEGLDPDDLVGLGGMQHSRACPAHVFGGMAGSCNTSRRHSMSWNQSMPGLGERLGLCLGGPLPSMWLRACCMCSARAGLSMLQSHTARSANCPANLHVCKVPVVLLGRVRRRKIVHVGEGSALAAAEGQNMTDQ